MKHTIVNMNRPLTFLNENKKLIKINGYAFIDECGGTIIIVYGDKHKDNMSEYLNNKGDILGIKYKCIKL